ncbi:hypothetical protein OpiT1DRAFT_03765 [Opitutaceae bacterium TAV1]|nr:hypothetical protein OpiT1DRAFT_03765 [Opitutaceae bacterium TAV1]
MSLKHSTDKASVACLAAPTWVRLAKDGEAARSLCFCLEKRSVSWPADALARWEFSPGNPDPLVITAGQETVTVLGRKLVTLRDALNSGRLLEVTVTKPIAGDCAAENEPSVSQLPADASLYL